jgi:glycosyltransferase involved in cell wall biosynthesis
MKVLLVGPAIAPPWTEGRKNFVRDLTGPLGRQVELRLLTTATHAAELEAPCGGRAVGAPTRWRALTALPRALRPEIERWRPNAVCHFPFGTLHGVRGFLNRWSIRRVDRISTGHGVRCLTIPYSITRGSRQSLRTQVSELVLAPSNEWTGSTITLGIDLSRAQPVPVARAGPPTVLFLAGERHAENLRYVLDERGLADVIAASPRLAAGGVRVVVAVPLLEDDAARAGLERRFRAAAPALDLELRAQVKVPDIFAEVDLYLFPYRVGLEQFVPTSILEAMAAGVPVVMSDLKMLAPLTGGGRMAYVCPRGEGRALAETVLSALGEEVGRRDRARAAKEYVSREWSIERSVADLLDLLKGRSTGAGTSPAAT